MANEKVSSKDRESTPLEITDLEQGTDCPHGVCSVINTDKLFERMQKQPIRKIDTTNSKVRKGTKLEFPDSEIRDAKLAERVVLAQIDIFAANFNSQLDIGYWELKRLFAKTRAK